MNNEGQDPSEDQFVYSVYCAFSAEAVNRDLPEAWLGWLRDEHIDDVIAGGAISGLIIELESDAKGERQFRIDYLFSSRDSFHKYETEHAPKLREEGLARFPLSKGLSYSRSQGTALTRRCR